MHKIVLNYSVALVNERPMRMLERSTIVER